MRFFNRWLWTPLGHIFRVKTIGDLLGWWQAAWWHKVIAGSAIVGIPLWQWALNRSIPEAIVMVLVLTVACWVALQHVAFSWSGHNNAKSGLQFVEWHASNTYSRLANSWPREGFTPTWARVRNASKTPEVIAKKVSVRLEFRNSNDTQLLVVPEAVWFEVLRKDKSMLEHYTHDLAELKGSEPQSFILFAQDRDSRVWVYKNGGEPVGILDFDHWTVKMIVTSDNVWGFEKELGFLLARDRFQPDGMTGAAPKQPRDVPPRMRQG